MKIAWNHAVPYLIDPVGGAPPKRLTWAPHPGAQMLFLASSSSRLCYMGDRGVGSTEALVMSYLARTGDGLGPAWQGMLLRYTYPGLADIKQRVGKFVDLLYPDATYNNNRQCWTFKGGEQLHFRCSANLQEHEKEKLHGHVYPWLGFDRLTEWPNDYGLRTMLEFNRSAHPEIPLRCHATGYVKDDGYGWVVDFYERNGEVLYGHLHENLTLLHNDPAYEERIAASEGS